MQTKRGESCRQTAYEEAGGERLSGTEGIRALGYRGIEGIGLGRETQRDLAASATWLWGWRGCSGFADDELGCEPDGFNEGLIGGLDALDEELGTGDAHFVQGLAHGGEAGVGVLGDEDVVEADDGDVAGAGEAGVFDGADGADGGGVVEAEDGGEVAGSGEEIADGRVAELGGPGVFFEIDAELGVDGDSDLLGDGVDGLPAGLGVEGEGLAFHKGDAPVTELVEVTEGETGSAVVVEDEIGDSGNADVGGDSDCGKGDALAQFGVDEKKTVDGAADEEVGVFLDEVGSAEMADGEVEIAGLKEIFFDAEHEAGEVALAELGDDDAHGVGEPGAKHAGVYVGTILEFFCRIENPLASLGRDGLGYGGVVEDDGDGCGREIKILGEYLEGDRPGRVGNLFFSGGHELRYSLSRMEQFYTAELENGISGRERHRMPGGNLAEK